MSVVTEDGLISQNSLFSQQSSYVSVARKHLHRENSQSAKEEEAERLLLPYADMIEAAENHRLPILSDPVGMEGQPMRNLNCIVMAYAEGVRSALEYNNRTAAQRYLRILFRCKGLAHIQKQE